MIINIIYNQESNELKVFIELDVSENVGEVVSGILKQYEKMPNITFEIARTSIVDGGRIQSGSVTAENIKADDIATNTGCGRTFHLRSDPIPGYRCVNGYLDLIAMPEKHVLACPYCNGKKLTNEQMENLVELESNNYRRSRGWD